MQKKLVIALAGFALLATACGRENQNVILPKAEPTIEEKAYAVVGSDLENSEVNLKTSIESGLKGMSLKIIQDVDDNGKPSGKMIAYMKTNSGGDCSTVETLSAPFKMSEAQSEKFVQIDSKTVFACLDENCDHTLVAMNESRAKGLTMPERAQFDQATVAVILKKDESGVFNPLSTESKEFMQLSDIATSEKICLEENEKIALEKATEEANERAHNKGVNDAKAAILAAEEAEKAASDAKAAARGKADAEAAIIKAQLEGRKFNPTGR